MRPGVDETFLQVAQAVSVRGECRRSQVGAILVDARGRLRGSGVNGVAPGEASCLDGACPRGLLSYEEREAGGSYGDCIAVHAESNLLINSESRDQVGGTVYITRAPCNGCMRLLKIAGVSRIVWNGELKVSEMTL